MARVVVAGAGAIGASIAYHLALRGADGVVLADVGEIAGGATGKAMGGVRQQFTTAAEVRLARASVQALPGARRAALRAGRLPLPGDERGGPRRARGAARAPGGARRAGRARRPVVRATVCASTTCSARRSAARTGSPTRPASRASSSGARPRSASTCASAPMRSALDADVLVIACGVALARGRGGARGRASNPSARAAARRRRAGGRPPGRPADDDRGERLPLPARRRRRAAPRDDGARAALGRARGGARRPRRGLARAARAIATRRRPARRSAAPGRASTT